MLTLEQLHEEKYHSLQSDRLLLRPLCPEDAPAMFAYTSQPENFRFLRRDPHVSVEEDAAFLKNAMEGYCDHREFLWGICKAETGELIGSCRLFDIQLQDMRGEVSYLIHTAYQQCGYATEAVRALIQYGFNELGLQRIQARCVSQNKGSEKVMQKCGMQQEGVLRRYAYIHGTFVDFQIYARLKEQ